MAPGTAMKMPFGEEYLTLLGWHALLLFYVFLSSLVPNVPCSGLVSVRSQENLRRPRIHSDVEMG